MLTIDRWWLRAGGELVYPGDSGTVEPRGRRRGWEATLYVRAARWLAVDAAIATNHARFVGAPGGDRIPNALESAGSLGLTMTAAPWTAALRLRRIGPRPLVDDNGVRGRATLVANARLARRFGRMEASLDLLDLLDTRRADAGYCYASRLPGEPPGGVDGVHARAVEPRQLRFALKAEL